MKTATRSAALLLTLGVGLFAMAGPAGAATSVVDVSDGTLIAQGAGVDASFSFTCDEGQQVSAFLAISQRVNAGRIARGGGGSGETQLCTGEPQTSTVTVMAESSAFKKGTALATVELFLCDPDFISCTGFRSIEEIQLTK